ncbi:YciI family protein [Massilia sp. TSP1-1-2]|uniref:YciI family protein n=1 Tax=unclassified Massilia TaxID=2609279 RepID=UPI003CFAD1BF
MASIKGFLLQAAFAALLTTPLAQAQPPSPHATAKPQQYLYMLRVAAHLQDQSKWSDKEKAAAARHFERLKKATAEGKVILAGRTTEALDKTFGLVIFEADSEAAAKAFMEGDPAVMAGVMTATLHPYSVALERKR